MVPEIMIIAAASIWAWLAKRNRVKQRMSVTAGREALPVAEIFVRFYSGAGLPRARFEKIWSDVAAMLDVSEELMRPTDRIAEFRTSGLLAQDDLTLLELAVGRAGTRLETIDDVVRHLVETE